ncbi:MAG: hypothetical protein WAT43_15170 [Chitinophagales bacterium]
MKSKKVKIFRKLKPEFDSLGIQNNFIFDGNDYGYKSTNLT